MDGISMEGLSKTGAGNVAAAIKSVPGVSVQQGKYVLVRGLGDRYTKTILNGVDIPGLDPERNTVQMDIFPSNILDNIQVVKSTTADLDADFTGGMVNIITKDFPVKRTRKLAISGSFNPEAHFNTNYLTYSTSPTDIFGFDNGQRDLPLTRTTQIPKPFEQEARLTALSSSFSPQLKAAHETSKPDFGLSYSMGNQFKIGANKLGYLLSISYKNKTSFYEAYERGVYRKPIDSSINELEVSNVQTGDLGKNNILISGLVGISYKTENSKYKLNLLHLQNGESQAGYFKKKVRYSNFITIYNDYLDYTQRSISNVLLSGTHTFDDAKWKINWKLAPTLSRIADKDVRLTPFEYEEDLEVYQITPSAAGTPRRIWRNLEELNSIAKLDVTRKHLFFKKNSKFKFGFKYTYKNRDYSIDQYKTELYNSLGREFNGNADLINAPENLWVVGATNGTYIQGNYEPSNTYNSYLTNTGVYIAEEFSIGEKLKSIIGLRAEKYDQFFTGQNNQGSIIYTNKKNIERLDLFPSLNLIYSSNPDTKFRFSYSRTTARPSFKESSISQIYDPLSGLTYNGNTDLQPSYIQNFDTRFEHYGEEAALIALSAFYKKFKDPIELMFYGVAPNNTQHRNIGEAMVYGVEIEFRKNLSIVHSLLKEFNLNVNTSFIQSVQEMDKSPNGEYETKVLSKRDDETISETRALQGQSPYLVNATLSYANNQSNWKANMSYNVQGKTLEIVGISNLPDVYTKPFHALNFNISKSFGKNKKSSIKLNVNNLLNEDNESVYQSYKAQEQFFSKKHIGRSFSVSYNFSF